MAKRRNPQKKAEPPRKPKSPVKSKAVAKPKARVAAAKKPKPPAQKAEAIKTPKKPVRRVVKPVAVSLERSESSKRISPGKKEEKGSKPAKPLPQKEAVRPHPVSPRKKAAATPTSAKEKAKESAKKPAVVAEEPVTPAFHVMEARPQPVPPPSPEYIPEPPARYGITRLVLMTRDSDWAFAYWEITPDTVHQVSQRIGAHNWTQSRHILRVYDVTNVEFNGTNAHKSFDIEVSPYANNWYIRMPISDRCYIADIGILTPYGEFIMLARSNMIGMPREGVSDVLDEEWATINYEELFRLSGGFKAGSLGGGSAFMMEEISKRVRSELQMGSMAVSSFGGQPGSPEKEKKFWLVVNTELIVYGATEPDAKVTVQDVPVRLNPDGTFSLRFALPDGQQVIPVRAMSSDGTMEQKITPIVKRTTE